MEESQDQGLEGSEDLGCQTAPWLVFYHRYNEGSMGDRLQTFFSVSESISYVRSVRQMTSCRCIPTPQGWMLVQEPGSKKCHLLNPATMEEVNLPALNWCLSRNARCTISSSPLTDPNCKIMCVDYEPNTHFYCSLKDQRWLWYDTPGEDDLFVCHTVALNGDFYGVVTKHALLFMVVEFVPDPRIRILEEMDFPLPVGMLPWCAFLLESRGDLFYVRAFVPTLRYNQKFIHIDVLKRDASDSTWSIVDGIGDRVFFLDVNNFSASWSASELGVKGNCIYFALEGESCFYIFDMDEGATLVDMPCMEPCNEGSTSVWILPAI